MGLNSTKLPQIRNVPQGLDPDLEGFLREVKETLEVIVGKSNRGNPLDRCVTVRELQNAGLDKMSLEGNDDLTYRFDDLQGKGRDDALISLIWPLED